MSNFEQILEMDDEDEGDHDFSRSIVYGFFDQAETTFQEIEDKLYVLPATLPIFPSLIPRAPETEVTNDTGSGNRRSKDLDALSRLGHFLKGSAATLGFTKLKDHCEKIQNYGKRVDPEGNADVPADECLDNIATSLQQAKQDYYVVEQLMRKYFET